MDRELEGAEAFASGVGFDQNPHKDGSEAGVIWARDWMDAELGEFRGRTNLLATSRPNE